MKTKHLLLFFMVLYSLSTFAQSDSTSVIKSETEWIAIKESTLDSLTLNYLKQKDLVTYVTPQDENNSVFATVITYLAGLLDSSLSSISKNTNKFYDTPIGFWAVWGTFYHYVGDEILRYLLILLYFITITSLFLWLWNKHGIHKTIPIDPMLDKKNTDNKATESLPNEGIIKYEIKSSSVTMQFWLLVTYIILFFIGACIL